MSATEFIKSAEAEAVEPVDAAVNIEEEAHVSASSVEKPPSSSIHRLYINNVNYQTTESDLYDLLKEFKVLSVLVPSHTVRGFKGAKQKSLGIAYVEFKSANEALLAKDAINGKELNGRSLRVKPFLQYSPDKRVKEKKVKQQEQDFNVCPDLVEDNTDPAVKSHHSESVHMEDTEDQVEKIIKPPVSDDTIFIHRLHRKTTDGNLREFFYEYVPTEVYIFKSHVKTGVTKPLFRHRYVSALITLSAEGAIEKALIELKGKKLKGRHISFKPAYLSKIEEVKNAAQAQHVKLEKVGKDLASAGPCATSATCSAKDSCSDCDCQEDNCCSVDNGQVSEPITGVDDDDEMALSGAPKETEN
ncbi:CYFA0S01e05886g1_1 [Cyberlindnera fabianii]|uniref:Regulator of rDNA transcription protein 5 n=1 Tax=Cyberlindnera fabianii TaxID=36022 RepID=A0A061ANR6_CYBFA|nr:CYFA0S01e05886g1_1 [Cyberlindnera fabianii]